MRTDDTRAAQIAALRSELEAISPDLAQLLDNPTVEQDLWSSDCFRGSRSKHGQSDAEIDLAGWIAEGTHPSPFYGEDATTLLEWLDPTTGGGTLETLNAYRAAWWLSHQLLRARLLEFLALPITRPRVLTQEDVETARRELGETIPHREAVKLPSKLLPAPPMQEAA